MSISGVSSAAAPPPVQPLQSSDPKPPEVKVNSNANDASAAPPTLPPLPPGQGTRINQLA